MRITIRVVGLIIVAWFVVAYPIIMLKQIILPNTDPVHSHSGDGTFQQTSRYVGLFYNRLYVITFPKFDLGKSYQATYHLNHLPDIAQETQFYLAIDDPAGRLVENLPGKNWNGDFSIMLISSNGKPVFFNHGKLSDHQWAGFDSKPFWALSKKDSKTITDYHENYQLSISYKPDPRLAGHTGFIYIRGGGNFP